MITPAELLGTTRPLSDPGRWLRVAPLVGFAGFAAVALWAGWLETPAVRGASPLSVSLAVSVVGILAALLLPWRRWPDHWQAAWPLAYFGVVLLLDLAGSLYYLGALPIIWLSLFHGRRPVLIGVGLFAGVVFVPRLLFPDVHPLDLPPAELVLVLALIAVAGVAMQGLVEHVRAVAARSAVAERQARADRDLLNAYLDHAPCLEVVFERDSRIVLYNRFAEQTLGYAAAEVVGFQAFFRPGENAVLRESFEQVLAGQWPQTREADTTTRSGERRRIVWNTTAMTGEAGRISRVISTGMDITGLRAAEREAATTMAAALVREREGDRPAAPARPGQERLRRHRLARSAYPVDQHRRQYRAATRRRRRGPDRRAAAAAGRHRPQRPPAAHPRRRPAAALTDRVRHTEHPQSTGRDAGDRRRVDRRADRAPDRRHPADRGGTGRTGAGARRSGPAGTGRHQPAQQRLQVHPAGRPGDGRPDRRRRAGPAAGLGHRNRHPHRRAAARLRPVLPLVPVPDPRPPRHRARPDHREVHRGEPRGRDRRELRAGRGHHVHHHAAPTGHPGQRPRRGARATVADPGPGAATVGACPPPHRSARAAPARSISGSCRGAPAGTRVPGWPGWRDRWRRSGPAAGRRHWWTAAAVAALLAVTVTAAAPDRQWATPRFTVPAGEQVAWGESHLFVLDQSGSERQRLTAYRLADGTRAWQVARGSEDGWLTVEGGVPMVISTVTEPSGDGGTVTYSETTTVLEPATGEPRWTSPGWPSLLVDGELLLLGRREAPPADPTRAGPVRLATVDLASGREVWALPPVAGWGYDLLRRGADGHLATLSEDGRLSAYDLRSGARLATVEIGPRPAEAAQVLVATSLALVRELGGRVTAYGLPDLDRRWTAPLPEAARLVTTCGPVLCAQDVVSPSALDPATGTVVWTAERLEDFVSWFPDGWPPDRLLAGDRVLDAATGEPVLELREWRPHNDPQIAFAWTGPLLARYERSGDAGRTWLGNLRTDPTRVEPWGAVEGRPNWCVTRAGHLACRKGDDLQLWRVHR